MKSPDLLDYASPPDPDPKPAPKWPSRASFVCAALFALDMTGLFGKCPAMLFLPPLLGLGAAITGIVQACLHRADPTHAAFALILNSACAACVAYLVFTD